VHHKGESSFRILSVFIGDAHIVTRRNAIKYVLNFDGLVSQMNLLENLGLVVRQSGFFNSQHVYGLKKFQMLSSFLLQ
jgi:hypothetical protein